jgi:hypothetical protein
VKDGKNVIGVFYNGDEKDDVTHSVKVVKPVLNGRQIDKERTLVDSQTPLAKDVSKGVSIRAVVKEAKDNKFETKAIKYYQPKK